MEPAQKRAHQRASNRLLRSAGFDSNGDTLDITKVVIKPATPIEFPEGLTKNQRKEYRKEIMLSRGEAVLVRGELVTAVEQKIRISKKISRENGAEKRAAAMEAKRVKRVAKRAADRLQKRLEAKPKLKPHQTQEASATQKRIRTQAWIAAQNVANAVVVVKRRVPVKPSDLPTVSGSAPLAD